MFIKNSVNQQVVSLLSSFIKLHSSHIQVLTENSSFNKNKFLKEPVPTEDTIHNTFRGFVQPLGSCEDPVLQQVSQLLDTTKVTNNILYSPQSYMSWHTNSDLEGWRTYYVYTKKPGIFRYKDPAANQIVDDVDDIGWTSRTFLISKKQLFWHCVWAEGYRFSFGFNKSLDD